MTDKITKQKKRVELEFATYSTYQFSSGAYLFKPDLTRRNPVVFDVADPEEVVIVSGPVFSEISVVHKSVTTFKTSEPGSFIHTVRLYHTNDEMQSKAIRIENNFDFGDQNNHKDTDLLMRIRTDLKTDNTFYTDQNGFQMQKRVKIDEIGLEGNYYPITTMTFMEDSDWRVNLIVDHAMGAASWQPGLLEVMVDRRSSFDDGRGMGEGILDNLPTLHKYWLLMESKPAQRSDEVENLKLPSQLANTLSQYLNYPSSKYLAVSQKDSSLLDEKTLLISSPLPCDMHLFNLRTLSDKNEPSRPLTEALLILQGISGDCKLNPSHNCQAVNSNSNLDWQLNGVKINRMTKTTLTGLEQQDDSTLERLSDIQIKDLALQTVKLNF